MNFLLAIPNTCRQHQSRREASQKHSDLPGGTEGAVADDGAGVGAAPGAGVDSTTRTAVVGAGDGDTTGGAVTGPGVEGGKVGGVTGNGRGDRGRGW